MNAASLKNETILITGGAGFIGSHLAEALLALHARVTVLDDLSTGSRSNLSPLFANPAFAFIEGSIENPALIDALVARHDLIYHLASAVGVKLIVDQPVKTVETIVNGTSVLLRACSRYRKPVLLTSSSEVYGKSTNIPFCEDDDVVMGATSKRRWAYACAKALDEFLGLAHFYESALPVFIVRLFNTVGPRQSSRYGMVLPRFVEQAMQGNPLTVYGSGQQQRCFCAVADIVRALIALPQQPSAAGQVVNLGSQEETSILDLARMTIALTGSRSEIRMIPYEQAYGPGFDDMERRIPDLSRAMNLIGWKPSIKLQEIIKGLKAIPRSSA